MNKSNVVKWSWRNGKRLKQENVIYLINQSIDWFSEMVLNLNSNFIGTKMHKIQWKWKMKVKRLEVNLMILIIEIFFSPFRCMRRRMEGNIFMFIISIGNTLTETNLLPFPVFIQLDLHSNSHFKLHANNVDKDNNNNSLTRGMKWNSKRKNICWKNGKEHFMEIHLFSIK